MQHADISAAGTYDPAQPGRGLSSPVACIKADVEQALKDAMAADLVGPPRLHEAMRYALLAPGKRARAVFACLSARQLGGDPARAHPLAVALEMVHTASLILDDLPCMDDASVRRGRPTTHRAFGEDTAVLAAVGLMNQATMHLAQSSVHSSDHSVTMTLIRDLTTAIGLDGLVGGQQQDLHESQHISTVAELETVYRRKTGVLFSLAAQGGSALGGAAPPTRRAMAAAGSDLGLAFQYYDDVLDATAETTQVGKDVRKDAQQVTIVSLVGIARARALAERHVDQALEHLAQAGGDYVPSQQFVARLIVDFTKPRMPMAAE